MRLTTSNLQDYIAEKSRAEGLGAENPSPHFSAIIYSMCDPEKLTEPL